MREIYNCDIHRPWDDDTPDTSRDGDDIFREGDPANQGLVSESSRIEALWHWVCQILSRTCAVILMWDIVGLTMINLKSCPDLTATSLLFKKTDFVSITTCDD